MATTFTYDYHRRTHDYGYDFYDYRNRCAVDSNYYHSSPRLATCDFQGLTTFTTFTTFATFRTFERANWAHFPWTVKKGALFVPKIVQLYQNNVKIW